MILFITDLVGRKILR